MKSGALRQQNVPTLWLTQMKSAVIQARPKLSQTSITQKFALKSQNCSVKENIPYFNPEAFLGHAAQTARGTDN